MNFKDFGEFITKRWFQVLILLGIFVILWKPSLQMTPKQDTQSSKQWFQDVNVMGNQPMNTESTSQSVQTPTSTPIAQSPSTSNPAKDPLVVEIPKLTYPKEAELKKNKALIIEECVRRYPTMSKWESLNPMSPQDTPSAEYLLKALEAEVGYEYLYSDVGRAVRLVMKKAGKD